MTPCATSSSGWTPTAAPANSTAPNCAALHLMQRLGIDTTDWNRVDAYCLHPRLAGKEFRKLTADELETLAIKLRIILRKENDKNNNNQLLN